MPISANSCKSESRKQSDKIQGHGSQGFARRVKTADYPFTLLGPQLSRSSVFEQLLGGCHRPYLASGCNTSIA